MYENRNIENHDFFTVNSKQTSYNLLQMLGKLLRTFIGTARIYVLEALRKQCYRANVRCIIIEQTSYDHKLPTLSKLLTC